MKPPVNRKDSQALTLVGPPRDNPESVPLAVLRLDNRLYIYHGQKIFVYSFLPLNVLMVET